jgi:hypothetical protein
MYVYIVNGVIKGVMNFVFQKFKVWTTNDYIIYYKLKYYILQSAIFFIQHFSVLN